MKKLFFSFLIILIISSIDAYSQVVWEEITTPNHKFFSVAVANNGEIFLGSSSANDTGGVYKSDNGGESWEFIGLEDRSIYSLSFNHEENLLAGVGGGIFLYNIEQGTWEKVFQPSGNTLAIEPGFNNTIFGGSSGVNRSSDDGYTWEKIENIPGLENCGVYGLSARSEDTIYLAATDHMAGGGVYRSIDGGDTWQYIGLEGHYAKAISLNSNGDIYSGCTGQHYYGWGGVYKLTSGSDTWDTLSYWPMIRAMVITQEDVIFCGFWTTSQAKGGVMHSEDDGETWVIDTIGMGNHGVTDLVMDNTERLYALAGYTNINLYRTSLPVSLEHQLELKPHIRTYCVPNPFSFRAMIYFGKPSNSSADLHLNIYSIDGKKMVTMALSRNEVGQEKILIERNNLTKGMYSYTISGTSFYCVGKFIIN